MAGSTLTQLLPTGGFEPGLHRSATANGLPSGSLAGSDRGTGDRREPTAEPPLLRGDGGALVGVTDEAGRSPDPDPDPVSTGPGRVAAIVAQLAPITSQAALFSSFEREANPNDEFVRAAYACVWSDLALGIARSGTRRARIRATLAVARPGALRGRG
jgi:hypothetical protein